MPRIIVIDGAGPVTHEVDEGTSLQDFMLATYPESGNFPMPVIASFAGEYVLRAEWPGTRLVGDEVAVFACQPYGGGGGSNPMQIAMTFALIVAAGLAGGAVLGMGIFAEGAALAGFGGIAGGLVSGAILAAGGWLMGSLFGSQASMPSLNSEAASPTYDLSVASNKARLFQPELECFGRLEIVPDLGAHPFTRYTDENDIWSYQVFLFGRGLYKKLYLSFGNTVFWRDGAFVEGGLVDDDCIVVNTLNLPLLTEAEGGGWEEPGLAESAYRLVVRADFSLSMPEGCCTYRFVDAHYDEQEGQWVRGFFTPEPITVFFEAQYRPLDEKGEPVGDFVQYVTGSRTFDSEEAVDFVVEGPDLPAPGRYAFRYRNASQFFGRVSAMESHWNQERGIDSREKMILSSCNTVGLSVEMQFFEPGDTVTLFPDNVETSPSVSGQQLFAPNEEGHETVGPFPVTPPGTTCDKILIDLVFPNGLGRINNKAELKDFRVGWLFEYQQIDDYGNALGEMFPLDEGSLALATRTPQRRTLEKAVPNFRWQVQARRTTDSSGDNQTLDALQWQALRGILPGSMVYPVSGVAIAMKGTNRLSQASRERFKACIERILPEWDIAAQAWGEPVPTRSIAAAVCSVCKSEWGGRATDGMIDLDSLWELDAICRARGWTYDAAIDNAVSVWDMVREICSVGRIIPRLPGEKVTFEMDGPDRPVTHRFTPFNIIRGTFGREFLTFDESSPDAVIAFYKDEDGGYEQRDVRVATPGAESREPAQRNVRGIVTRPQAHDYSAHLVLCNRWRRLPVTFQTEAVARRIQVGDICTVEHPRLFRTGYGKLLDWEAAALTLELDRSPEPSDARNGLYLTLNDPQGRPWGPVKLASLIGRRAVFDAGDYAALIGQGFEHPWSWLTRGRDRLPTVWVLQNSEILSGRFIVESVQTVSRWRYTLRLINDAPEVYDTVIPMQPWEARGNSQQAERLTAPASIRVERASADSDSLFRATWLPVYGATGYVVEFAQGGAWNGLGTVTASTALFSAPPGDTRLRVAAFNEREQGPFGVWQGNTGQTAPDAPEPELVSPFAGAALSLQWAAVTGAENYRVRIFAGGNTSLPVRVRETTSHSFDYTPAMALVDRGPWRELKAEVIAQSSMGESQPGVVDAFDPAPSELPLAQITATSDALSVTFAWSGTPEDEVTGYVIARGQVADFLPEEVLEVRRAAVLPFVWSGLQPGTRYHFRIAAADAFFDVTTEYLGLNWSASITVETANTGGNP